MSEHRVTALSLQVGATQKDRHLVWYWKGNVHDAKVQYGIKEDYVLAGCFTPYNSVVEYGRAEKLPYESIYTSCKVRMCKLIPGRKYVYRVGTEQGYDENIYEFDVHDNLENKQTFNVISDLHMKIRNFQSIDEELPKARIERWQNLLETMLAKDPDIAFIMSAGDNISSYNMGIKDCEVLRECGENEYRMLFEAPLMKTISFASVLGNHEASELMETYDAGVSKYHFDMPNDDGVSGHYLDHSMGNFWFRSGNVLIIGINAVRDWTGTREQCSPEIHRRYIKAACDLNKDAIWKLLVNHISVYTYVADEGEKQAMHSYFNDMINDLGIDAVFTGHAHVFSRSKHILDNKRMSEEQVIVERDSRGYQVAYSEEPKGSIYFTVPAVMDNSFTKVCSDYHDYLSVWGLQEESLIAVSEFDGIAYRSPMYVNVTVYEAGDKHAMTVKTMRSDILEAVDTYTIYK